MDTAVVLASLVGVVAPTDEVEVETVDGELFATAAPAPAPAPTLLSRFVGDCREPLLRIACFLHSSLIAGALGAIFVAVSAFRSGLVTLDPSLSAELTAAAARNSDHDD
jgi:hypothetical protein